MDFNHSYNSYLNNTIKKDNADYDISNNMNQLGLKYRCEKAGCCTGLLDASYYNHSYYNDCDGSERGKSTTFYKQGCEDGRTDNYQLTPIYTVPENGTASGSQLSGAAIGGYRWCYWCGYLRCYVLFKG